jgi:hypothetical protein
LYINNKNASLVAGGEGQEQKGIWFHKRGMKGGFGAQEGIR